MEQNTNILNKYEELISRLQTLTDGRESMVSRALDFIKDDLTEIDSLILQVTDEIAKETAVVKSTVLQLKETVRGNDVMAVYSKPSTKWDTSKLDGYAIAHPEILVLKHTGEPNVSFRKIARRKED